MVNVGTIVEINHNKTYVFTLDCSMIVLRTKENYMLGQQITFTKRDKYPEISLLPMTSMKTLIMAATVILLITVAAIATITGQFAGRNADAVCTALVSVDINPSVEISINKEGEIISVQAKNEDGMKLINNLELSHVKLAEGVDHIISTAKDMGYMKKNNKVVLVSATLYDTDKGDSTEGYKEQLKEILASIEQEGNGADLLTVYIDDSAIIDEAKDNDLSIGRELLYQYAKSHNLELTAEDIRNAGLNELLNQLDARKKDGNLVDTLQNPASAKSEDGLKPTATPDKASGEQSTDEPAAQVTPSTEKKATHEPEPKPTPEKKPSDKKDPKPTLEPKPTPESEPTPKPKATSTPKPTPTAKPVTKGFDPNLKVDIDGTKIAFDWTELPSSSVTYKGNEYYGFQYYKVVASQNNDHPIYPDDGYLTYITDYSDSDWSVNPYHDSYNCSPELISGEAYYVSITYVFENGKFTSDVKRITVPKNKEEEKKEESNSVSSLKLSVNSSGDTLKFNWTPVDASTINYDGKKYKNFYYYKVVASKTNKAPKYPDDGYLTYITDYNTSSWAVNPNNDSYNYSPQLESGEKYYFSITYVFENGKIYSNTIQKEVP